MTSKLQRFIDLEIEAELQEEPLSHQMEQERKQLRNAIESKLGIEFTTHKKEYEPQ